MRVRCSLQIPDHFLYYLEPIRIAETGSGKTLAFSIPALHALAKEHIAGKKGRTPRMLVLAPTREVSTLEVYQLHTVYFDLIINIVTITTLNSWQCNLMLL